YSSSRSTPPSADLTPGSSSTMRMLEWAMVGLQPTDYRSTRQFNREPSATRRVVRHLDAPAVLGDDPADDREAQPAAPAFGREGRHEKLLTIRGVYAGRVVGHDNAREVIRRVVVRLHGDDPAALHRLDGVVDQI